MPFELGMVMGCKKLGGKSYARRSLLILERNRFTYQKCLSDIAGQDTKAHNGSAQTVVRLVRTWLAQESRRPNIPGEKKIFAAYTTFSGQLPTICEQGGLEHAQLSYPDLLGLAQQWLIEKNRQ